MKLQAAIDRVSLTEAVELTTTLAGQVDIIEIGTSLIKDYGNEAISKITTAAKDTLVLADIKTMDEGEYEFRQGFTHGADILTVMGAASLATIEKCFATTVAHKGTMMVDLLEVSEAKMTELSNLDEELVAQSIFCLHHSIDREDKLDAAQSVADFKQAYPKIKRIGIAGGIDLTTAKELAKQGLVEIVIVGSKISGTTAPETAAKIFMEGIK